MQTAGDPQKGGFDPGLLALISVLVSGGVGSYGYSKAIENAKEIAEKSLSTEQKEIVEVAKRAAEEKVDAATKTAEEKVKGLEKIRDDLEKQLADLRQKADTAAGPALTFKAASAETLKDAGPKVAEILVSRYTDLAKGKDAITKALDYPTTYQAKLEGLTLPMFWAKRIQPLLLQQIATKKGGRRRGGKVVVRKGPPVEVVTGPRDVVMGRKVQLNEESTLAPDTAASYASKGIPSYEEFAAIYEDAIRNSTVTAKVRVDQQTARSNKEVDDRVQKRKDDAAKNAAEQLSNKFVKALRDSETKLDPLAETFSPEQNTFLEPYAKRLEDTSEIVRSFIPDKLSPRQQEIQAATGAKHARELRGVVAALGGAQEGGLSLFSSKPKPVSTEPLPDLGKTWNEIKTAEDWNQVKEPAQKILTEFESAVKDYVAAVKAAKKLEVVATPGAPSVQGPTTSHDKILTEVPPFLKEVPGVIKEINGMKKGLASGMKELLKPEQYRGGCAIRVIADEFEDILNKLSPLIERRHEGLKEAFNEYKKETKDQPIYDSAIQRDDAKLAESRASIDTAVRELNARIETFFASVERMKGGARVLEKVYNLMDQIDLGVYALKRYMANVLGLKDSYDTILGMIEEVKDKRLETPAEWEEEKKSCPGQIETMRKAIKSRTVPIEFGDTATMYSNPLRGDTEPVAPAPTLSAFGSEGDTAPVAPVPASVPVTPEGTPVAEAPTFTDILKERTEPARAAQELVGPRPTPGPRGVSGRLLGQEPGITLGGRRRSRKSTLKTRRGGKQNVRGSRRRKNRADRSHSHSR
jgi:hypothetical protein